MGTTQTHEFSFPTTTTTSITFPSTGFESPPLWRLSPAASPHHHRRRFSYAAEYSTTISNDHLHVAGEKKMDMLWEDFNEEELITSSRRTPRVYPVRDRMRFFVGDNKNNNNTSQKRTEGVVDVGCIQGRMRLSPKRPSISTNTPARMMNSTTTTSAVTKPSLVVLMKVLKRLFLLYRHKHTATSRRPSTHSTLVKVQISRSSW
ncbi:hypothetical protein LINPERHAP1_LOCUS13845 [Linum perenne]